MTPELGILADDLTGATDTGLQFAKSGRRTSVGLNWPAYPSCDVLVLDTDSRNQPAEVARRLVSGAARGLRRAGAQRFYKKIDSTGRGNLGAEIEASLEETGAAMALISPAFPQLGRTVRDGRVLVRGVALDQSEFARDPLWPATTASLDAILRRQTTLQIGQLSLDDVRQGPTRVRASLRSLLADGRRLVIADAETGIDLRCLAEAVQTAGEQILPVGSAGLAEWLVGTLPRPARPARVVHLSAGPILVVAGTMNRIGVGQVARVLARGARIVVLDVAAALDDPEMAADEAAPDVAAHLAEEPCVVLALRDPRASAPDLSAAARARDLELPEASARLMRSIARATEQGMDAVAPAALILTGGDTARVVCGELGTYALDVSREIAPGVPLCQLQGGRWDGLPVVTKAGGFGELETLARVVLELEGMRT